MKKCWVFTGYFCNEKCPFHNKSTDLFALLRDTTSRCRLTGNK